MNKAPRPRETSLARYDWSRARRGHWAGRLQTAKSILLRPDLYAQFGSTEAITAALEAVVQLRATLPARKRKHRAA